MAAAWKVLSRQLHETMAQVFVEEELHAAELNRTPFTGCRESHAGANVLTNEIREIPKGSGGLLLCISNIWDVCI